MAATPVLSNSANIEQNIELGFFITGPHMAKLKLVKPSPATWAAPSRTLGKHGRSLWDRVMIDYEISDIGGLEMLMQACAALDRAEALRIEIDRDGEVIRVRGTVKDHPALKHELANRAFVVRTLARLGSQL
jgi:hypothetical protein